MNSDKAPKRSPDNAAFNLRRICLVCGQEIEDLQTLESGTAVTALAYRHGIAAGTGYAHAACKKERLVLDLTGKPDYGDYRKDRAVSAFADGYDAHEQGRRFDAALREEAAEEALKGAAGAAPEVSGLIRCALLTQEREPLLETLAALLAGKQNPSAPESPAEPEGVAP